MSISSRPENLISPEWHSYWCFTLNEYSPQQCKIFLILMTNTCKMTSDSSLTGVCVHAGVSVIWACMQFNSVNQPPHFLPPVSLERTLASGQKKQTEELSALSSPLVLRFTLCLTCAQAHKQTHAHICEVPEGDDEYPVWMDWIINNINENTLIAVIYQPVQTLDSENYGPDWLP